MHTNKNNTRISEMIQSSNSIESGSLDNTSQVSSSPKKSNLKKPKSQAEEVPPSSSTAPKVEIVKEEKSMQYYYRLWLKRITTSINIIKAIMMRVIFSAHSLIAIVFVYLIKQEQLYFWNLIGIFFLAIEAFVTIYKRKGKDPKW